MYNIYQVPAINIYGNYYSLLFVIAPKNSSNGTIFLRGHSNLGAWNPNDNVTKIIYRG